MQAVLGRDSGRIVAARGSIHGGTVWVVPTRRLQADV